MEIKNKQSIIKCTCERICSWLETVGSELITAIRHFILHVHVLDTFYDHIQGV